MFINEFALFLDLLLAAGFLSILYSIGSKPLQIWDKQVNSCDAQSARFVTLVVCGPC